MQETRPMRYRCKKCGDEPEPESHHAMKSCKCGFITVDRGWYGSRVLWKDGPYGDAVEEVNE